MYVKRRGTYGRNPATAFALRASIFSWSLWTRSTSKFCSQGVAETKSCVMCGVRPGRGMIVQSKCLGIVTISCRCHVLVSKVGWGRKTTHKVKRFGPEPRRYCFLGFEVDCVTEIEAPQEAHRCKSLRAQRISKQVAAPGANSLPSCFSQSTAQDISAASL